MPGRERKTRILHNLLKNFTKYDQVMRVNINNISTKQITKAREMLRKEGGVLIVGKDSITRLAIRILTRQVDEEIYADFIAQYPERKDLTNILNELRGKFALIFTDKSYVELKPMLEAEKIQMGAKAGIIAPNDVWIRSGPTGIDPGKIGEFHRLNIQVKTARSAIEVTKDFKLCPKGEVVSETVSAMCRLLDIIPFEYAMELDWVYSGQQLIPKEVIDMKDDEIMNGFTSNIRFMTALSVEAGLPNKLSVPHFVVNAFKMMMAIGEEAGYEFKELKEAKEAMANAPVVEEKKEEEQEEEEEEEEEDDDDSIDMGDGFDMFG
jgi:large subunit ribosomal protein LP0